MTYAPSTQNADFPSISACVTHIAQVSSPLPHPDAHFPFLRPQMTRKIRAGKKKWYCDCCTLVPKTVSTQDVYQNILLCVGHVAESGATQEGGNGLREVRLCGRIAGTSLAIHLRICQCANIRGSGSLSWSRTGVRSN